MRAGCRPVFRPVAGPACRLVYDTFPALTHSQGQLTVGTLPLTVQASVKAIKSEPTISRKRQSALAAPNHPGNTESCKDSETAL